MQQPAGGGMKPGAMINTLTLNGLDDEPGDIAFIRLGHDCYQTVTSEIGQYRAVVDRDRHRDRKSESPSSFAHAGPADTGTRIAPAVITMANAPA